VAGTDRQTFSPKSFRLLRPVSRRRRISPAPALLARAPGAREFFDCGGPPVHVLLTSKPAG
jgi:hypothetical protein